MSTEKDSKLKTEKRKSINDHTNHVGEFLGCLISLHLGDLFDWVHCDSHTSLILK